MLRQISPSYRHPGIPPAREWLETSLSVQGNDPYPNPFHMRKMHKHTYDIAYIYIIYILLYMLVLMVLTIFIWFDGLE